MAGRLLVAIPALSAFLAFAGDPIQFSGEKGKQGPQQEKKVDNDLFKSWNKDSAPNPLSGYTPYMPAIRTDPKDEKRLRKEREEKRNWLLLNPGDLTGNDDEGFGGHDYSLDALEKDSGSGDYTLYPLLHSKSGQGRGSDSKQRQAQQAANVTANEKFDVRANRETEMIGAHTSRDLDLKGLLDTKQTGGPQGNRTEITLFDFLRDNSAPRLQRSPQLDEFKKFINSSPTDPMAPRIMDFGPDLTQRPISPNFGLSDPLPVGPRTDFSPRQDFARPAAPGFSDPGSREPFGTPYAPGASPLPEANVRPPISSGSMFNNNNLRRPGI